VKILLIGSGGREHAIAWKLKQSGVVEKVWCAPGNGGMSVEFDCVPLNVQDANTAARLAAQLGADLTIVGPEVPLVNGIADEFAKQGALLLGPSKAAAQLEGSKIFAKQVMERNGIPTAKTIGIFDSADAAKAAVASAKFPLVIKADGLAAGKGVLVALNADEATAFIERVMTKKEFGAAGERVLIESALDGKEISYIILTDGTRFVSMAPTRDHKRALDGDKGPNTGGMGTFSTAEILEPALEERIIKDVIRPTLDALTKEKLDFRGFIFFGLMLTADGPQVLEYNVRMGDPETQSIVRRANFDLAQVCFNAASGKLDPSVVKWKADASLCVVIASEGYPGDPVMGVPIKGLADAGDVPGVVVFHAGTRREDDGFYTHGGRVLGVSATGASLEEARAAAYSAASKIRIQGAHYRSDIGLASSHGSDTGASGAAS
jgi:phosphoribosylamine--glycine ligase